MLVLPWAREGLLSRGCGENVEGAAYGGKDWDWDWDWD